MHSRVELLQQEHTQLRALLRNCESSAPKDLAVSLRRLEEAFVPHHRNKLALYEDFVRMLQDSGDKTSVSLLTIFRSNMRVTSEAIVGFLQSPDPNPNRYQERFRTVASTLRSMLSTEEKVVFPICARYIPKVEVRP